MRVPSHLALAVLLVIAALAVLLSGCGRRETPVQTGIRTSTLHAGIGAEPRGLDPHRVTGIPDFRVIQALFEGLVAHGPSDRESVAPGVAESWTRSADGRTFTFTLRADARWSDGRPVTSADFRYAYRRILNPALGSPNAELLYPLTGARAFHAGDATDFKTVGVRAPDPRTLVLTLARPLPHFLELLKHPAWLPLPRHLLEEMDAFANPLANWTGPDTLVSNGPFRLLSWESATRISVVRSETYWNREAVRLHALELYPIDNAATELRAFRNGQLHLTDDVPTLERAALADGNDPAYREYPILATTYLLFNTRKPPLDDQRVRRALALAVDRRALTENIVLNSDPAAAFTPGSMPDYALPADAAVRHHPERARALIADAGYPGGAGFPALEYSTSTSDTSRQVAEAVQQMWQTELGIEVRLFNSEFRVYLDQLNRGNFDIGYLAWYGDFVDPVTFLNLLRAGGASNRAQYANPAYDRLLERAGATYDPDARRDLLQQAEALMLHDAPIAPVFWLHTSRMVHPAIKGWQPRLLDLHPWHYLSLDALNNRPRPPPRPSSSSLLHQRPK